jgi:hypothetical protein
MSRVLFFQIPQVGVLARILSIKLAINGDCPGGVSRFFFGILRIVLATELNTLFKSGDLLLTFFFPSRYGKSFFLKSQKSLCWIRQPFFWVARKRKKKTLPISHALLDIFIYGLERESPYPNQTST